MTENGGSPGKSKFQLWMVYPEPSFGMRPFEWRELPGETDEIALGNLIHTLQQQGYTQLRSQRIFHGDRYLGSQELWVEYPDPRYSA